MRRELKGIETELRASFKTRGYDYDDYLRRLSHVLKANAARKRAGSCVVCNTDGHARDHNGAHFPNRFPVSSRPAFITPKGRMVLASGDMNAEAREVPYGEPAWLEPLAVRR